MLKQVVLALSLMSLSPFIRAEESKTEPAESRPQVQVVQLLDLVGIPTDEVDHFLQQEILKRGYQVIPMTEKPDSYYVLYILTSNVASGGAVATGLSSVIAQYDRKTNQETLVDHASTVILVSGPDMEESARRQGLKALEGIVDGLDEALKQLAASPL